MQTYAEHIGLDNIDYERFLRDPHMNAQALGHLFELASTPGQNLSAMLPHDLPRHDNGVPTDELLQWLESNMLNHLHYTVKLMEEGNEDQARGLQRIAFLLCQFVRGRAEELAKGATPLFKLSLPHTAIEKEPERALVIDGGKNS